jgi:hypothetical protein
MALPVAPWSALAHSGSHFPAMRTGGRRAEQARAVTGLPREFGSPFEDLHCGEAWLVGRIAGLAGMDGEIETGVLPADIIELCSSSKTRSGLHFAQFSPETVPSPTRKGYG